MFDLIDFHSHILPGIDDGSGSVETSVQMLKLQREQGVSHVVLTPHFYPRHDEPDQFLAARAKAMERLQQACRTEQDLPQLHLGAEVAYFGGMSECDDLPRLAIENTGCILVELPMGPWDNTVFRELREIVKKQHLTPVIAHIDRYLPALFPGRVLEPILELPVLLQVNAGFFLRRGTAGQAMRMLERGMIHVLGTDSHDLADRAPNLGKAAVAIQKKGAEHALQRVCEMSFDFLM